MGTKQESRGRFAPSPSGRMHLGNIYAALLSFLSVKGKGGKWILRHEDLDRQRCRREYAALIEDDLRWLGLEWDEGGLAGKGDHGPYLQSERDDIYRAHIEKLCASGFVYPCYCRRADLLASSAPHQSDGRIIYGGRCRPESLPDKNLTLEYLDSPALKGGKDGRNPALRLYVPDRRIAFDDMIAGRQEYELQRDCGDFIVRRSDGGWAYQLAVVVDDALMGVTEVVRGEDLLLSTAQQIYLYELLDYPAPRFGHIPLLRNADGQRLSKRDSSESMESLRARFTPQQLLGRLAMLSGITDSERPVQLPELLEISRPEFSKA